ncbi:hypothetical protein BGZ75_010300 [Mortierella antarctica]|nr:hypothetical protein BGZ75_010300 [Mortierella antarctica]
MERAGKQRFQPYARQARRPNPAPPVQEEEEGLKNIPKVILSFVKKSLNWLGITQQPDPELERELHTTDGDFEFLPAADKSLDQEESVADSPKTESARPEGDLRDYITSLKTEVGDEGLTRNSKRPAEEDAATKAAKRNAYLLQLRSELLADMSDSDEDLSTTPIKNPFMDQRSEPHPKAPVQQPIAKSNGLEKRLASRHDIQHDADLDDEEPDGLLSEAELVLLGRVRRLVQASAPKPKWNTIVRPEIVPPEKPPSIFPSRHSVPHHAHENDESAVKFTTKPLDTIMPYNRDHRRHRKNRAAKNDMSDQAMDSGDSDDEDDAHVRKEWQDRNRRDPGSRQRQHEEASAESTRTVSAHHSSYRSEHEEDQRTSHGGLQVRSQVTPKRHVRSIPGRFSALDSEEEEEWFRNYDKEQAKRKAQQEAHGTNGSNGWSAVAHGIANGLQQTLPSDAFGHAGQQPVHHGQQSGYPGYHGVPNYRLPPQIYPTLQYGRRSRLYHPKLDEVLAWTSSKDYRPLVIDTWRCRTCDHRTNVLSSKCDRCNAPKPGPIVLNTTPVCQLLAEETAKEQQKSQEQAKESHHVSFGSSPLVSAAISAAPAVIGSLATAAGAAGIAAAASNWASSGFKMPDNSNKWKCPACDVMNENSLVKCACCDGDKPGEKKAAAPSAPAPPALFTFGSATSTSNGAADKDKEKEADKDKDENNKLSAATKASPMFSFGAAPSATTTSPAAPSLFGNAAPAAASSGADKPAGSGWAATGFKMPDTSNKWKCPTCDVMNENSASKCPCCETAKPGDKAADTSKPTAIPALFAPPALSTSSSAAKAPPVFSFGGAPSAPVPASAAATSSPAVPSLFGNTTPAAASSGADKPAGPGWAATGFKMPDISNKWKCPTCDVMNENSASKCPCCETAKPGGTASGSTPAATSMFGAFKSPASTGTPLFGLAAPAGSSLFSTPAATPAATSGDSASKPPVFSFGAPTAATTTPATSSAGDDSKPSASISFANPFASKPPGSTGSTPSLFGTAQSTTVASSTATTEPKKPLPSFPFGTPVTSAGSTSAPLFGASTSAPAVSALFGASSSTTAASTTPLFGASALTPAASTSATLFGGSTAAPAAITPAPLFGASTSAPAASTSTPLFGGQTVTPAATTSAPLFGAASSAPAFASASPFGAVSTNPATTQPSFGFASTTQPSGVFALGGAAASNDASSQAAKPVPSFSFGSSSAAPGGGFGGSAPSTTSTASPFTFGNGSGAGAANTSSTGFGGFGASPSSASNSMMSPTIPAATGAMNAANTASSGFGGFGGFGSGSTGSSTPAISFGSSGGGGGGMGASAPSMGFGAAAATPAPGFTFGSAVSSAPGGSQATPFGQNAGGFGANQTGSSGFGGAGSGGFGAAGSSSSGFGTGGGFGGGSAGGGGFISIAGQGAPAFGGSSGGSFGAAGGMQQQQQQQQQQPGGFVFGASAAPSGSFGLPGMTGAPGSSFAPPQQPLGGAGGFSFNMGSNPDSGNGVAMPKDRKIAKMRSAKKRM